MAQKLKIDIPDETLFDGCTEQDITYAVTLAKTLDKRTAARASSPNVPEHKLRAVSFYRLSKKATRRLVNFLMGQHEIVSRSIKQISDGIDATKTLVTDNGILEVPDHKARNSYIDKVMKIQGLYEHDRPTEESIISDDDIMEFFMEESPLVLNYIIQYGIYPNQQQKKLLLKESNTDEATEG